MTEDRERIAVAIGTTEGPSLVIRIAAETPEVRSVVCLNMGTEALPISPAYDAFVRRPTGIIERELGEAAYRADVSAPIDAGSSWQLGLYLAHRLAAAGRLAAPDTEPDRWIWVTGTLDTDLVVGPIEELARKLETSTDWFAKRGAEGRPVTLIAPATQAELLDAPSIPPSVRIMSAVHVEPVLAHLDLDRPNVPAASAASGETAPGPFDAPARPSWSTASAVLAMVLAFAGLSLATWVIDPSLVRGVAAWLKDGAGDGRRASDTAPTAPRPSAPTPPMTKQRDSGSNAGVTGSAEPTVASSAMPRGPKISLRWTVRRPRDGRRCGDADGLPETVAEGASIDGPVCTVTVLLVAAEQARVDLIVGFVGRLRDYTRNDRHVQSVSRVLRAGEPIKVALPVPGWVRGDLRARAIALAADPAGNMSHAFELRGALALLQDPPVSPAGMTVEASAITVVTKRH